MSIRAWGSGCSDQRGFGPGDESLRTDGPPHGLRDRGGGAGHGRSAREQVLEPQAASLAPPDASRRAARRGPLLPTWPARPPATPRPRTPAALRPWTSATPRPRGPATPRPWTPAALRTCPVRTTGDATAPTAPTTAPGLRSQAVEVKDGPGVRPDPPGARAPDRCSRVHRWGVPSTPSVIVAVRMSTSDTHGQPPMAWKRPHHRSPHNPRSQPDRAPRMRWSIPASARGGPSSGCRPPYRLGRAPSTAWAYVPASPTPHCIAVSRRPRNARCPVLRGLEIGTTSCGCHLAHPAP